jgi:PilZ domain
MGTGTTVDLSTGGILFESDHKPAAPGLMELAIAWPAKPDHFPSMRLMVIGRVVRVAGTRVALRIRQHGFSTATH